MWLNGPVTIKAKQRPSRAPSKARSITLAEVARHSTREDGWIVVDGVVYDITNFVAHHPGWDAGGATSTAIAIGRALGTDCGEEFRETHSPSEAALLAGYAIGALAAPGPLDGLPEALHRAVCLLLDGPGVRALQGACTALRDHVASYGEADRYGRRVYLPVAPVPRATSCPGLTVTGDGIVARARWMDPRERVVEFEAASPGRLFEVVVDAMRGLTLHVGVQSPDGRRSYVDGAGRAHASYSRICVGDAYTFAYGSRFAAGTRVGVAVDGRGALRFSIDRVDQGVAFEGVPPGARFFVRFALGCVDGASGDAIAFPAGGAARVVDPPRAVGPRPLANELVVEQFSPDIDDWFALDVDPRTTTVRELRAAAAEAMTRAAAARGYGGVAVRAAAVDVLFGTFLRAADDRPDRPEHAAAYERRAAAPPLLEPITRRAGDAETAGRLGDVTEATLDRLLADFGIYFHGNGVQSRPVYANVAADIS